MLMLLQVFQTIFGQSVTTLSREIASVKKKEIEAKNDERRLVYQERLAILEAQKSEMVNASKHQQTMIDNWEIRLLIFIIAGVCVLHMVMVVLDSTYNFEMVVNKLPEPYEEYQGKIILSFFGLSAFRTGIKAFIGKRP